MNVGINNAPIQRWSQYLMAFNTHSSTVKALPAALMTYFPVSLFRIPTMTGTAPPASHHIPTEVDSFCMHVASHPILIQPWGWFGRADARISERRNWWAPVDQRQLSGLCHRRRPRTSTGGALESPPIFTARIDLPAPTTLVRSTPPPWSRVCLLRRPQRRIPRPSA